MRPYRCPLAGDRTLSSCIRNSWGSPPHCRQRCIQCSLTRTGGFIDNSLMHQSSKTLEVRTRGRALVEITHQVRRWAGEAGVDTGLLTLFIRHTSASLLIQENADPEVQRDLERFFARLVPDGDRLFEHTTEGADDMPAHVRAALTQTHLSIPIIAGALALGTWQGIYLYEHRTHAHTREIVLHLVGE